MISWLLKTKPVRKTKASKTSGIVKNISRKTLKGVTKKTRETTSSGLPRKQAYLDALSNYIRAATDHGQLGVEEQGLIDFGSTKIEGDTWHVTRVPEGPEIHLVLAKSEPHTGADFPRNIVNSLMQQIYKDLHEVSFDGITRYTTDLTPRRPQRNNVTLAEWTRYSVQKDLAARTKEMMSVIENARLHHPYRAQGGKYETTFLRDCETSANTLRNAPDNLGRVQYLARRETRKRCRYGTLATEHGWMMLSILANSVAFRYAAHHFNHDTWVAFGASIGDNARSIEMFAKVRGLNWRTALTMEPHLGRPLTEAEIRSTLNVPTDHPHNFTLPLEGDPRRPQHQGHDQVNVDANIYNAKLLTSRPRPNSWPQGLPFPHDPTVRRAAAGNCFNCGSARICACRFDTSIAQPLVEIVAYPDRGNGIRALQAIPAGSIIGEYIGEINPIGSGQDPTYNLEFSTAEGTLCEIHCRRYGNWTRYMNHSCRATAFFDSCTVGNRATMCIRTVRDIDIFDEITIDYGSEYWQEAALCRCGEPACRYDTPKKVRAARALQVEKDELAFQARTEAARKKKRGE